jgi:hypothetical protein
MGILPHGEVRKDFYFLARRRKFVVRGKRDKNFVANAVDIHDDLGWEGVYELAVEESEHGA